MPALKINVRNHVSGIPGTPEAMDVATTEAVRCLSRSALIPVHSGRMKRSVRKLGSGTASRIFYPVHYASYQADAIVRALKACASQIRRAAQGRPGRRREALRPRLLRFGRELRADYETEGLRAISRQHYERYVARVARERGLTRKHVREMIRDRVIEAPSRAPGIASGELRIRRRRA